MGLLYQSENFNNLQISKEEMGYEKRLKLCLERFNI